MEEINEPMTLTQLPNIKNMLGKKQRINYLSPRLWTLDRSCQACKYIHKSKTEFCILKNESSFKEERNSAR